MLPLDLSLTANEEEVFSRVGRTVFAKSVDGEIEVTGFSNGGILVGKARMVQGNRYVMAADFTRLQIRDVSGAANNVRLLAGLGDFSEAGLGTIDSITNPVNVQAASDLPVVTDAGGSSPKTASVSVAGLPSTFVYSPGGAFTLYHAHVIMTAAGTFARLYMSYFGQMVILAEVRAVGVAVWDRPIRVPGGDLVVQVNGAGGTAEAGALVG